MEIEYSTLQADVASWREGHLERVRDILGESEAHAEAMRLEDDPWVALQWYAEDMRSAEQSASA